MLQGHFSLHNKFISFEMTYDRNSWNELVGMAEGSNGTNYPQKSQNGFVTNFRGGMTLLAEPPFLTIVNINNVWTRMTKYMLQMEVKGLELFSLVLNSS